MGQYIRQFAFLVGTFLFVQSLSAEQLEKWCNTSDPDDVKFTNVALEVEGYEKCGNLSTITLCDATGKKYFGPADSVPSDSYQDCSLGQRIYVEKDGIPVDVNEAMRLKPKPVSQLAKNSKSPESIPSVPESLDKYYDLMDQLMNKDGQLKDNGNIQSKIHGIERLDKIIEPLLKTRTLDEDFFAD